MAGKRKTTKKEEITPVEEETIVKAKGLEDTEKEAIVMPEKTEEPEMKPTKKSKKKEPLIPAPEPKHKIGSIVFVSKDADADLNGFKLFPQYKKYTYTVEAYDEESDVYTLRRLNLSLKLKSEFILAPEERAHDTINRKQF